MSIQTLHHEITDAIFPYIQKDFPFVKKEDVTVRLLGEDLWRADILKTHQMVLNLEPKMDFLGNVILSLKCSNNEKQVSTLRIPATVTAKVTLFKAKHRINKGEKLREDHFTSIVDDITSNSRKSIFDKQDFIGKEAKTPIAAATVLTEWMVSEIPIIRSNERIKLMYKRNNLEVSINGKALEDGHKGSKIRVQADLKTNKTLIGTVVDSEHVQVHLAY